MLTLTTAVVDDLALAGADADAVVERVAAYTARAAARRQHDRERRLGRCVVCAGMGRGYVPAAGRLPAGGRCVDHLPPQPSTSYCAPRRCYCGACPELVADG